MLLKFKIFLMLAFIAIFTGCSAPLENINKFDSNRYEVENESGVQGNVNNPLYAYEAALQDATDLREDKIRPLVCLTNEDTRVQIKDDKVLLATWHNVPQIYEPGRRFVSDREAIWAVSAKEFDDKIKAERSKLTGAHETHIRLCQLLGRSVSQEPYTHISYVWAQVNDVARPAYQMNARVDKMTLDWEGDVSTGYKEWFENTYQKNKDVYPWTRLGYTCDWAEGACAYGMTEFIIKKGAVVEVQKTISNDAL